MTEQRLLTQQRHALILEAVRRDGAVRLADLVGILGVSAVTVRRDLVSLEKRGMMGKVRGGAVAIAGGAGEPGALGATSVPQAAARTAVADRAAGLVRPGSVIGLGAGRTTHAIAERLLNTPDLTIVTNSLTIEQLVRSSAASTRRTPAVILTGGTATRTEALVGPVADRTITSLHMDLLILGTHGVSESEGLTSSILAEAQTNRVFISRSRQVVVAADHTKWGTVGLSRFADLRQVGCFVTDDGMPSKARAFLRNRVGECLVVETGPPPPLPSAGG
ncbi:DeoR/GlpR family DNA-binding transcription regulator [Kitasatospora sp. NPDC088346]|uniref:DeoR/GlpR family DNA-binding transcription regulator n=1 Tax=Kitasatospora sp. NPDC088346 TaxID=3364073 RepID=UPI003802A405